MGFLPHFLDMKRTEPLVSVIIPTRNRPNLVVRAVGSVLAQTLDAIEVIVIIDGPDETTLEMLRLIDDPRLRVQTLPVHLGAGGARNAGVAASRSQWIAFLDDDDEWFPKKLELQYEASQRSHHPYPIISCRLISRNESGDLIWPRRYPRPNEPLSEYLFCQSSLFGGEGLVPTPTILTLKELLQKVPFRGDLQAHEDWDWLLRASTLEGVRVEFLSDPAPLVIWHMEDNRRRISTTIGWRYSLSWVQTNRYLLTPRAYPSFIMTQVSLTAAQVKEWKAFWFLLWEAYRNGKPSVIDILAHTVIWLIPKKVRTRLVRLFDRMRGSRGLKHS
jgi:glycosyltransferase involved in cell wall biosynthesis